MTRRLANTYLALTVLGLFSLTGYFFVQLSETRATESAAATGRFADLSAEISELWQTVGLPDAGDQLTDRIEGDSAGTPLVISVYSFDDGIDYLWATDGQYLDAVPDSAQGAPRIRSNDIVHARFSRSFELPDGRRRIVTAVYPVLTPPLTYPVLRNTLAGFLGLVAVGLTIGLIHVVLRPREARPRNGRDSRPAPAADEPMVPGTGNAQTVEADTDDEMGLMPLARLEHRVSLELERAGFHEQDLSVAFFCFPGIVDGAHSYRNARAILSFFTFDDLCFDGGHEKHTQTIVVLFPNTSLSEALGQIERFQRFYWEERETWDTPEADFHCGVSARNGRLVEAQRILRECRVAVRRAADAPGRIIGFQPDPQRYREFISRS